MNRVDDERDEQRDVTGSDLDTVDRSTPDALPARRRRFDRGLFLASLVIALGIVLIIWGVSTAMTGNDGIDRPDTIESLQPVENAVQVLQQERVVVDLAPGYEGRLEIDGVVLPMTIIGQADVDPGAQPAPGQQVDLPTTAVFDPGSNVISFQPVDGALIESFEPGLHEARVVFWRIDEGPEQALSYRWEFEVI